MGNPIKRAARAKKAAKSNNILRQHKIKNWGWLEIADESFEEYDFELQEKLIAVFGSLPPPKQKGKCLAMLHRHITEDPQILHLSGKDASERDLEELVAVTFDIYCEWLNTPPDLEA